MCAHSREKGSLALCACARRECAQKCTFFVCYFRRRRSQKLRFVYLFFERRCSSIIISNSVTEYPHRFRRFSRRSRRRESSFCTRYSRYERIPKMRAPMTARTAITNRTFLSMEKAKDTFSEESVDRKSVV